MSTLTALMRHEAREARVTLVAAPILTLAVLGVVHASFARAGSLAYASSATVAVLVALWTVYFASDTFAADHASGRLRTRALLPVTAMDLWRAKIAFLAVAVVALGMSTLASGYGMHVLFGTERSLEIFEITIRGSILPFTVCLPLVAASAVLCSLVVESALVAILLSLIVDACLVGLAVLSERAWSSAGVAWTSTATTAVCLVAALALLALGALAFRRGQRRMGALRVRARTVVSIAGLGLLVGGFGTASEVWRRRNAALEHPHTTFCAASSSPDGRYLAVEVEGMRARANSPRSVWLIDLETKEFELAAADAILLRDAGTYQPMPWDAPDSLRVQRLLEAAPADAIACIRVEDGDCTLESAPWVQHSHALPAWADVTERRSPEGRTAVLTVRWTERVVEHTFPAGVAKPCRLGREVFVSPHPGRVLHVEDGTLFLADLDDGSERALVPIRVQRVDPSPDRSAVLVQCKDEVLVFSTLDGARLPVPWPEAAASVSWVEGSSRTVLRNEFGRGGRQFVHDLGTGIQFELKTNRTHHLLHRLPDGGYVHVDENENLVRVDAWGGQPEILVDR